MKSPKNKYLSPLLITRPQLFIDPITPTPDPCPAVRLTEQAKPCPACPALVMALDDERHPSTAPSPALPMVGGDWELWYA